MLFRCNSSRRSTLYRSGLGPNLMFKVKKNTQTSIPFEQEVKTYLESTSGQFAGVTEIE